MSTWTLIPSEEQLLFRLGGTSAAKVEICGEGRLELSDSEITDKRGTTKVVDDLRTALKSTIPWYLLESHKDIITTLEDADALGAERARAATVKVGDLSEHLIGLLSLGSYPCLRIAGPKSIYERIYRLLEARISNISSAKTAYHIRGQFDLGLSQIEDHRVTPQQFSEGQPLLSCWVEMLFREPSNESNR